MYIFKNEKEYRDDPAIHYSQLSALASHPNLLTVQEKEDKDYFDFGSMVDSILLEESFNKKFTIVDEKSFPSESIRKIIKQCVDHALVHRIDFFDEMEAKAIEIARENGMGGKTWKDERIFKDLKEKGSKYFYTLSGARGKTLVSKKDHQQATKLVTTLQENRFTSKYFKASKDVELKPQFGIKTMYRGFECKCLFDMLIIDNKNKVIIPVDLKTTGDDVRNFPKSFLKFKYYIQAGLYKEILQASIKEMGYENYKILSFRFIVINSKGGEPIIYPVNDSQHQACLKGGWVKNGMYKFKGVNQLIEELEEHKKLSMYDYPLEVHHNKGIVELDVFK